MRQLLLVSAIAAALTLVLVPAARPPRPSGRRPCATSMPNSGPPAPWPASRTAGPGVGVRGGVVGAQPAPAPAGPAMGGMMPGTVETSIRWTTAEEEIDVKEREELATSSKPPPPRRGDRRPYTGSGS